MKKRYMTVILAILLIIAVGTGIYWVFNTQASTPASGVPQNQNDQANNTQEKETDTEEDTPQNKQEHDSETASDSDSDNPDTLTDQLTNILSESLQKAVDIFSSNETHVTAVGDSLTQGVGDQYDAGGYVGILKRTIQDNKETDHTVTFDNFGKRGNRSDQLLKRLDNEDIQASLKKADIVLITIGANDVMKVVKQNITNLTFEPFEQEKVKYRKRLQDIMKKVKNTNDNAEIYLLGFYNPFDQYFSNVEEFQTILSEWNNTSRKVANEFDNISFIPVADLFRNADKDLFADDNFHPNYYGYERMANRVLKYLGEKR